MPDDPATDPPPTNGATQGPSIPSDAPAGTGATPGAGRDPAAPGAGRDPAAPGAGRDPAAPARRAAVAAAGLRGDEPAARLGLEDPDAGTRAAALGALARIGVLGTAEVAAALADRDPAVRRRAAGESVRAVGRGTRSTLPELLRRALGDPDPLVAEAACWALGERRSSRAVPDLAVVAGTHPDTRCREAAVAALGAVGDPAGLPAVLTALTDRPTVRRRATVALAAFSGPEVDRALRACLEDRDWQVREAAEILLGS